ncbi:14 kDa proline-rich protein DC2.15-like [Macadamia integrifolia]|uniref:14 kDa proline-rich protein DC2.15-like n=1 Tax=Macadamia integrifolia TaxID=60698 RepID=UPI001C52D020|nr:14 kDa proline-rich protein DC2.15-like [Macadamia integrifolia]
MANKISVAAIFYLFLFGGLASACEPCKPKPKPPPKAPPVNPFCPKDTLKLGICIDLLGVVNVVVGTPPSSKCCSLLQGLADLEAAVCLCTVIKENVAARVGRKMLVMYGA